MQFIPAKNQWANSLSGLGEGLTQGYMQRSDENAIRDAVSSLGPDASARDILNALTNTKTYSPQAKQQALKNYLGAAEFDELKRKAKEQEAIAKEKIELAKLQQGSPGDQERLEQSYREAGYPEYLIKIMSDPNVAPGIKQQIALEHRDLVARNVRKPLGAERSLATPAGETPTEALSEGNEMPLAVEEKAAPIAEAIEETIEKPQQPKKDSWPKIAPPPGTTLAEQEKWKQKNQDFNNKILKEVKTKESSHANALIRYNRLSALNNSGKLPEGMGRLVINPETGDPYAIASLLGLVNKETQDFTKTMNDFLINAKDYFGARVTNFDVQAFKSRLPGLLNTPDGRRMIIEQMKLMEELQDVHDSELSKALKHYGRNASYSDIQGVVDERTADKEAAIIDKLNNLDDASKYLDMMASNPKFKDHTLMQTPEGKFRAVPNEKVNDAKAKGYIKW